jgi:hypothetical protein
MFFSRSRRCSKHIYDKPLCFPQAKTKIKAEISEVFKSYQEKTGDIKVFLKIS